MFEFCDSSVGSVSTRQVVAQLQTWQSERGVASWNYKMAFHTEKGYPLTKPVYLNSWRMNCGKTYYIRYYFITLRLLLNKLVCLHMYSIYISKRSALITFISVSSSSV